MEGLTLKAAKHVSQQASAITQNDIKSDTTGLCVCVCVTHNELQVIIKRQISANDGGMSFKNRHSLVGIPNLWLDNNSVVRLVWKCKLAASSEVRS